MKPPPRYSVSPLHSFGVVPIAVRRGGPTLFGAMLGAIWRHMTGRPRAGDIGREVREVSRLAAEAEARSMKPPPHCGPAADHSSRPAREG